MKYIIETTPNGCKETLIYNDDKLGTLSLENSATFINMDEMQADNVEDTLDKQLNRLGFSEEIPEEVEQFAGMSSMFHFKRLAEMLEGNEC